MPLTRREALCGGCALALAGCDDSATPIQSVLGGTPPVQSPEPQRPDDPYPCEVVAGTATEGWVRVSYDDFPALRDVFGSATTTIQGQPLVIAQVEAGCWVAIARACTHEGVLIDYREGRNGFVCPRHGAAYAWDGRVLAGPAPRDLEVFACGERDGALWVLM